MTKKIDDVRLLELNEAYQKVLYWFFSFPNLESTLNELSEELQMSKTTAKRIVEMMIEEGFLTKKVYGRAWRIKCNLDHPYNQSKKVAFNLSMIFDAYFGGVKNSILELVENTYSVTLFGSYRKGDDTENSDIDIAVEVDDNKDVRIVELGVIPHFGHRNNVPINLHIFCRNKIDINLFSNIANGIVIEGFLEVRP